VPAGSVRYWSWLFAAPEAREPLLGIYALLTEWRALMNPGTERGVAQIKLVWWGEEMSRMAAGAPRHPITRHLAALPRASSTDFTPLTRSIEAAGAQIAGVPLEQAGELESHADALYGVPLVVAALLGGAGADGTLRHCIAPLAAAQYLAAAIAEYGREARAGRVPFPVDDLLAADIDNEDLLAPEAPPRLRTYLDRLRRKAAAYFSSAAAALAPDERPRLRHMAVLATLGAKHLNDRGSRSGADFRLADLYNAWNAARRSAAGR
jgi:phytoene synthase